MIIDYSRRNICYAYNAVPHGHHSSRQIDFIVYTLALSFLRKRRDDPPPRKKTYFLHRPIISSHRDSSKRLAYLPNTWTSGQPTTRIDCAALLLPEKYREDQQTSTWIRQKASLSRSGHGRCRCLPASSKRIFSFLNLLLKIPPLLNTSSNHSFYFAILTFSPSRTRFRSSRTNTYTLCFNDD